MSTCSLDLEAGSDAVPAGRHAARAALAGTGCPAEVLEAVELVVTELISNAILHGAPPLHLEVVAAAGGDRVRLEVHDGSRVPPVRPRPSTDGMTGRGLALVDALAEEWGVEPTPDGKAVWAELTPHSVVVAEPGEADLDALLAAFDDDGGRQGPRRYVVQLGDVPTDLLLAAKAHVDSVVRELTLADTGARYGITDAVPASLAALVHDVVTEFAEARQAIKRQALAAAAEGRDRTTLRLVLPAEAAAAGERYLAALEEADAFARASRLLTLAAPPQHAAFRRWYVTSLVAGLRRASADEQTVVAPTFEAYLLDEVDHLAALQSVSDRAARLQRVTEALAGALLREDVTRISLEEAVAELGADRGVVLLPGHRRVVAAATIGYPQHVADRLQDAWDADVVTPGRIAWETARSVWVESREERDARYPDFAAVEPDAVASCAVPFTVAGHQVGVLRLSFAESRLFDQDERAFVEALAAVAAQALERADLYDARGTLAERLVRLQAVAAALATTRSTDEVLDVAIDHATGLIGARVASISLLREDGRTLDLARMQPPLPQDSPWASFAVDADLPASEAVRSGRYLFVPSLRARNARWPAIAGASADFEHSFAVVPLHAEAATIGALTLSFPAGEADPAPSREFLVAFADACAQALRRARAAERAVEAGRQLAFLASASEELARTLDIETTLGNLARLAVPHVADWCVLHLLQDGELVCVAVEHVDPDKRALAVAAQQRWPASLDDPSVGRAVRDGQALLLPSVEQARRDAEAAGAPPPEPDRQALLDRLGLQSAIIVPLVARGRALGALTFVRAEADRAYGSSDLAFAEDLARRAAVAVDNARLYAVATGTPSEVTASPSLVQRPRARSLPSHADDAVLRWHVAQEAGRLGAWDLEVGTGQLTWDEQSAALLGLPTVEPSTDVPRFLRLAHPEDRDRVREAVEHAVATGDPLDVEFRVLLPGGGVRHLLARGRPLAGPDGRTGRLVGAIVDVTELREAASAESRAASRLAGLGEVALRLATAETVHDLAAVVVDHGMRLLGADSGAVYVRDDAHDVLHLATTSSLPELVEREHGTLPLAGPLPGSYTARTGNPVLLPTRRAGLLFAPEMALVHAGTGRSAWASLPLRAADRLLGSLVVGWEREREFSGPDEELLAAFAAQCALALDRIQVLEAERRAAAAARQISETLQRSLLTRPPQPPGLQVAVRYVPASQEAQVGGDWYDAFPTADGVLNLVIGDCTGRDREAVAAMAAVRNLLRATAYAAAGSPAAVLTALDRTMAGLDVPALATALLARVEPAAGGRHRIVWSSAGHLPLVVRRADGAAVVLSVPPDLMLGLLPDSDRAEHSVELEAGATVLLYTDGMVERRGEDIDEGVERLRAALTEVGGLPLEQVCDTLLHRLGGDAEDDVALVAVLLG